ncbi:addiction module protein [Limnohabitans sp. JirII-31]|jgi:Putative addiction module component|uniref:addiction module protein n=1 Tax=Limnohabitans sp. JirII-31 TaxID=1977908 RepID=UPI000C1EA203|nr:addiction module protein [Limnohabitans sp. JirII-31]PIT75991.1 hypothetical protein B9Z41_11140 [Limnohabitans sp. JirII-31]
MTTIDIAAMPASEKLKLMEALWDSLCVSSEGDFESPAWHEQALKDAEQELAAGVATMVDWDQAKDHLRARKQA